MSDEKKQLTEEEISKIAESKIYPYKKFMDTVATDQPQKVEYKEGDTAKATTGENIILKEGKWVLNEAAKPEEKTTPKAKDKIVTDIGEFEIPTVIEEKKEEIVEQPKTIAELLPYLKSKYNFNVEKIEDFAAISETHKQSTTKLTELEKENISLKKYKSFIDNQPAEVSAILLAQAEGKDYREEIKKIATLSQLDFTKKPEDYDEIELIKHYNPELTNDELEELNDKSKTAMKNAAIKQFNIDKEYAVSRINNGKERQQKYKDDFIASAENSLSAFKLANPTISETTITELKTKMLDGWNMDLIDDKGLYKKEAAQLMAEGYYGGKAIKGIVERMTVEIQKVANRRANEEKELILKHQTNDTSRLTEKGAGGDNLINIEKNLKNYLPFINNTGSSLKNRTVETRK
jgi:hypothetical protein